MHETEILDEQEAQLTEREDYIHSLAQILYISGQLETFKTTFPQSISAAVQTTLTTSLAELDTTKIADELHEIGRSLIQQNVLLQQIVLRMPPEIPGAQTAVLGAQRASAQSLTVVESELAHEPVHEPVTPFAHASQASAKVAHDEPVCEPVAVRTYRKKHTLEETAVYFGVSVATIKRKQKQR